MKFNDLKYFAAFIIPILVITGIQKGGIWTYSALIFAFVIIPIVEQILPSSTHNLNQIEKNNKLASRFFNALLYLNIPINYFILFFLASAVQKDIYSNAELTGLILSTGAMLSASGINVGHELGHKSSTIAKWACWLLYLPSLYLHFYIEHNRGHHKHVATPKDPASARKGEIIYFFWFRSIIGGYTNSWSLEFERLKKLSKSPFHYSNLMIGFTLITVCFVGLIITYFGLKIMMVLGLTALVSVLFLETINYIEHYGLKRKILPSGRYERVLPIHSWNSNHTMGRIVLYELTRHSDHHYIANKNYQVLDHFDDSPQLPLGYPASMVLSLIPFLWFRVMNPLVMSASSEFKNF